MKAYVFDGSAWEALDPCMYVRSGPPTTLTIVGVGKVDGRACRDCEEWSGTPFVVLYFAGSGAVVPVVPEESALRRLMLSERDTAHDDGHALFGGGRS